MSSVLRNVICIIVVSVPVLLSFLYAERIFDRELSGNGRLISRSSHLHDSLALALTLVECGEYSHRATQPFLTTLPKAKINDDIRAFSGIDCENIKPSFAVENGHSLLLAAAIAAGGDTILILLKNMMVIKWLAFMALVIVVYLYRSFAEAALVALLLGYVLAYNTAPFVRVGLTLVTHNYSTVIILFGAICIACAYDVHKSRRVPPYVYPLLLVFSGILFTFQSIYRSVDFYALSIATIATGALVLVLERRMRALWLTIALIGGIALAVVGEKAHGSFVKELNCPSSDQGGECDRRTTTIRHSFWHPIILGLGAPATPITKKYGYGWKSDLDGLIPAKLMNPNVDQLYTEAYSAALRDFYFHAWRNDTALMLESYWIKARSLFGIGLPVYVFGLVALGVGIAFRDYSLVFFSALFGLKAIEANIIYSPYFWLYHQYQVCIAIIMGVFMARIAYTLVMGRFAR